MFSCKFCEISKHIFLHTLPVAASGVVRESETAYASHYLFIDYEIWKKSLKINFKNKLFSLNSNEAKRNKHIKTLQVLFPLRSL